jgi:hypothetical protein
MDYPINDRDLAEFLSYAARKRAIDALRPSRTVDALHAINERILLMKTRPTSQTPTNTPG